MCLASPGHDHPRIEGGRKSQHPRSGRHGVDPRRVGRLRGLPHHDVDRHVTLPPMPQHRNRSKDLDTHSSSQTPGVLAFLLSHHYVMDPFSKSSSLALLTECTSCARKKKNQVGIRSKLRCLVAALSLPAVSCKWQIMLALLVQLRARRPARGNCRFRYAPNHVLIASIPTRTYISVKMKSPIVNFRHAPSLSSRPVYISSCRSSLHLFLPTCRLTYGSPWTPRSQHSTS